MDLTWKCCDCNFVRSFALTSNWDAVRTSRSGTRRPRRIIPVCGVHALEDIWFEISLMATNCKSVATNPCFKLSTVRSATSLPARTEARVVSIRTRALQGQSLRRHSNHTEALFPFRRIFSPVTLISNLRIETIHETNYKCPDATSDINALVKKISRMDQDLPLFQPDCPFHTTEIGSSSCIRKH